MGTADQGSRESPRTSAAPDRSTPQDPTARPRSPAFETIESAARRLGVSASALRTQCVREGRRVGDCTIAFLGDDVVAFKFGRRWRVRFKEPTQDAPKGAT